MIIGLCGYAQSGKDTAASALVEQLGFTRLAFADALKNILYDIHPRIGASVDLYGWDYVKANVLLDGRAWLQRLGVACRQHLYAGVWVDAVMCKITEEQDFVISDVRFPNEIDAVIDRGGALWRIDRPGVGAANDHVSEHAWNDARFDRVLVNCGTEDEFKRLVVAEVLELTPCRESRRSSDQVAS